MNQLILTDLGIISSLGHGKQATWQQLFADSHNCLTTAQGWIPELDVTIGQVHYPLERKHPNDKTGQSRCALLAANAYYQIENTVQQAIREFSAQRVGVVIGTSTSGTLEAEQKFAQHPSQEQVDNYHYQSQEMGGISQFISNISGAQGVSLAISTACSSGTKAMISAANLINSDVIDAAIVGGADSLCRLTVNGFHALNSLSPSQCNPFSVNRNGINIGEGAALFLMQKGRSGIALTGLGESSDAHHMSAPHPQGNGAYAAMNQALKQANISVEQLDYINLHGTATPLNDQMESEAVHRLGGADIPCSSTKAFTGHTLAAAGAIEAGICYLAMSELNHQHQYPPHIFDGQIDKQLKPLNFVSSKLHNKVATKTTAIKRCLSNSFAFGGSNACLVLEQINHDIHRPKESVK